MPAHGLDLSHFHSLLWHGVKQLYIRSSTDVHLGEQVRPLQSRTPPWGPKSCPLAPHQYLAASDSSRFSSLSAQVWPSLPQGTFLDTEGENPPTPSGQAGTCRAFFRLAPGEQTRSFCSEVQPAQVFLSETLHHQGTLKSS